MVESHLFHYLHRIPLIVEVSQRQKDITQAHLSVDTIMILNRLLGLSKEIPTKPGVDNSVQPFTANDDQLEMSQFF